MSYAMLCCATEPKPPLLMSTASTSSANAISSISRDNVSSRVSIVGSVSSRVVASEFSLRVYLEGVLGEEASGMLLEEASSLLPVIDKVLAVCEKTFLRILTLCLFALISSVSLLLPPVYVFPFCACMWL